MAKKTELQTPDELLAELRARIQKLEGALGARGIREARLERRPAADAEREASRLLDRYGHQHGHLGLEASDELVGLCAIGANAAASSRAKLEVHMHRRKNGLA